MAPEAVVHATKSWLQSSWKVQVPFAWLEACVEWLQEEAGGAGRLSQQQINQQALDQWLLTDLRDLDHPVLPEGLAQSQKTELRGTYCVQVDSLLDISQPAYGQLQKWRGTDCANDEVSAVTQTTQRPWEAKSSRMLLLQITDGVQSLEAMEYQPISALSISLRPGAKLQLQGQMVCRLGVLLLGPSNIKVLGGEVEDLAQRNNQGKVLCRVLGLPEEQRQEEEEAPPSNQGNMEVEDLTLDDQELLASLEAEEEEVEMDPVRTVPDSGYGTSSSSVRSLTSNTSSRSEASIHSYRSVSNQGNRGASGHFHSSRQEESALFHPMSSSRAIDQEIAGHSTAFEDFPKEDFDDLALDEWDDVVLEENTKGVSGHRGSTNDNSKDKSQMVWGETANPESGQSKFPALNCSASHFGSGNLSSKLQDRESQRTNRPTTSVPPESSFANDEMYIMDEDMDCFLQEVKSCGVNTERTGERDQAPPQRGQSRERGAATNKAETSDCGLKSTCGSKMSFESSHTTSLGHNHTSSTTEVVEILPINDPLTEVMIPALTLSSPPYTYLCLLEEMISKSHTHAIDIRVKAFIVTLLGKLSSSNGLWRICATISDGTGYLDAELSNEVLMGLLGFSVAEKGVLKRDPSRRAELEAGISRCQEELVDMCCVMTVTVEPGCRKAVVTKVEPVDEKVQRELEQRVRDRKK